MTRSPKRTLAATMLVLESVVVIFAGLVAKDLSGLSAGAALAVHGGIAAACLATAALLRLRAGYLLGTLLQPGVIATGVWVPLMYGLGTLFALLWLAALRVGGRIERERALHAPPGGGDGGQ